MKKLFTLLFLSMLISIILGNYIFASYKSNMEHIIASSSYGDVYMILYGSYNNKSKVEKLKIDNYILKKEGNFYRVYVGATSSLDNAERIKNIYLKQGASVYIRNEANYDIDFVDYLQSVDNYTDKTDEDILEIQKNIVKKYKDKLENGVE